MISVNHNLSAMNVANTLSGHYGRLQTSTQRLSSGLRVNSAADDAAGLAIRELMRADIQALGQGIRNANDAISMIQTFDGALSVIDEKLIRMKELAEQAATGTYNSTQRLMIDSEFQAMGAEIDRIARATEFNGIKLLDGANIAGDAGIAVHTEIATADGTKKFDVTATAKITNAQMGAIITQTGDGDWDLSEINNPDLLPETLNINIENEGVIKFGDQYLLVTPMGFPTFPAGTTIKIGYDDTQSGRNNKWLISGTDADGNNLPVTSKNGSSVSCLFTMGGRNYNVAVYDPNDPDGNNTELTESIAPVTWNAPANNTSFSSTAGTSVTAKFTLDPNDATGNSGTVEMEISLGNNNTIKNSWYVENGNGLALTEISLKINSRDITPKPVTPPTPAGPTDPDNPMAPNYKIPEDVVRIHFGAGADKKEDFYDIKKHDATLKGLGLDGVDIQTQDKAQGALVQINDAIVAKDQIRAEYGANQNRLENTVSNLTIQMENLQASESRISDTDIANEMMLFVRDQILTQSAVAMLAQANNLPQMVLRLIN